MSDRRCEFCGKTIYWGRSDKRYCNSTCRRDACRARERKIRLHGLEIEGSEWGSSGSLERQIPRLERIYGANHRIVVRGVPRRLKELKDAEWQELVKDRQWIDLVAELEKQDQGPGDEPHA
jgi:hypothetical protein